MSRVFYLNRNRDMVELPEWVDKFLRGFDDRFHFNVEGTNIRNRVTVHVVYTPSEFVDFKVHPTGFELNLGSAHYILAGAVKMDFAKKINQIVATADANEKMVREHGYPWGKEWLELKPLKKVPVQ